jgi:hypothetical protein
MEQWRTQQDGLAVVGLKEGDLSVLVMPELGGKVSSIKWRGREILARNARMGYRRLPYGSPYDASDASGFDECMPTIGACPYPGPPLKGVELPDHGELWSQEWDEVESDHALSLAISGKKMPFSLTRSIDFVASGRLRFTYLFRNGGDYPINYLWSAHPLVSIRSGMRIYLPEGVRVLVSWSRGNRLGEPFSEHPWPITNDSKGQKVDLGLILSPDMRSVEKLYTTKLNEGWCALLDPGEGLYVAMVFSPEQIPYIGLSINFGGWPEENEGYYNLGLEPCNGYPDRLDLAMKRGDCGLAQPYQVDRWAWDMCIGQTDDFGAELKRLRLDVN